MKKVSVITVNYNNADGLKERLKVFLLKLSLIMNQL